MAAATMEVPQKEDRDLFPPIVRKFKRQIRRKHPKAGSCFLMEAFMEVPIQTLMTAASMEVAYVKESFRKLPSKLLWK